MSNWIDSVCNMIKEVMFYLCWLVGALGIVSILAFLVYRQQSTIDSRLAKQIKTVIGQTMDEDEHEIVKLLIQSYDPANDNLIPDGDAMTLEDILRELKVDKTVLANKVIDKVTEKVGQEKAEDDFENKGNW